MIKLGIVCLGSGRAEKIWVCKRLSGGKEQQQWRKAAAAIEYSFCAATVPASCQMCRASPCRPSSRPSVRINCLSAALAQHLSDSSLKYHATLVECSYLRQAACQRIFAYRKFDGWWGMLCRHGISFFANLSAHYLTGVLASRDDVIAIELLGSVWGGTVARMKGLGSSGIPDDLPVVAVLPDRLPVLRASLVLCVLQGGHASQLIHVLQVG